MNGKTVRTVDDYISAGSHVVISSIIILWEFPRHGTEAGKSTEP